MTTAKPGEAGEQERIARQDGFSQMIPERVWLTINNQCDGEFKVILEINGADKTLCGMKWEYLDPKEGHYLHSHSLTWLFNSRNTEIADLKAQIAELKKVTQK